MNSFSRMSLLDGLNLTNSGHSSKKNKHCKDPEDRDLGDCWIYTAIKSNSGLLLAHCGGKRTDATCDRALDLVFERIKLPEPTAKIIVASDGNLQYGGALSKLYCQPCIDYGQVIKKHENNRLVEVLREKTLGNPALETISTSIVEGYNNKIRQRISRFGRKTASFSKKIISCIGALNMFQFMSNFIDAKERGTPAMIEGLTDHAWTWREFLCYHIQL
jgi:IS1 family transposase